MKDIVIRKVVLAGVLGTVALTMVATFGAPMMGLPKMDIPGMLAQFSGLPLGVGWIVHFGIGTVLALGYTLVRERIPGPAIVSGALYGIAPWLMAQIVVMPMMGMGLFSGAAAPAMGSLIGHLIYGGVVGLVYAAPLPCKSCCS
jgi:uncharacterized membrane protein YagU involved in acid resistance